MGSKVKMGLLATVTLAGMLSTMAGVASADANDPTSFSMYIIEDSRGFDPGVITWAEYQDSMGIYESLVRPGVKGPVAAGATSWTVSKDGKTYTFHLRKNEKFSNGDPVTAQDYVFAWQRAIDPVTSTRESIGSAVADYLPVLNEPEIRSGDKPARSLGVKALDDYTFQVKLYRPDPTFIRDLTLPTSIWTAPLDQKVVKTMFKKDWTDPSKIVSNGPYMIQSYKLKTEADLVPNPYYWGKVNLKKVIFRYTAGQTGLIDYKNGRLDAALLNPTDIPAVMADPNLKSQLHFFPTSVQYTLELAGGTVANNPLFNVKVRQALMMAIDRDTIANKVLLGAATPAYEYFSPTWLDPWIKQGEIKYNPTQAKKLLAQAGYPNGKGFPLLYITVGVSGGQDTVAQAVQQMWQDNLGIKVKYNSMEYGQFSSTYNKPLPDGVIGVKQASGNFKYPQLLLPTSQNNYFDTQSALIGGFLPPDAYAKFYKVDQNQSLSSVDKHAQLEAIFAKYLPKDVLNYINTGVQAYQQNSDSLMKKYYLTREEQAFDFPIYTPMQPVLLRPGVNGYTANKFLLTSPPQWLNDITRN